MNDPKRRTSLVRAAVLLLACLLVVVVTWHRQLAWRIRVVQMSAEGSLDLGLGETIRVIAPPLFGGSNRVGFVTLIRREGKHALWKTPLGEIWARQQEDELLEHLIHEMLVQQIYAMPGFPINKGDIVLDIGSHLGAFTLLALKRGAARVICLEPEPENVALFGRTFQKQIAAGTVVLVEAAAWKEIGTLQFAIPSSLDPSDKSARGQVGAPDGITVRAVTIDSVVEELGLDHVDFLKLDIEGAEASALKGALNTLAAHKPKVAVALYHRPGKDEKEVVPLIRSASDDYVWRMREGIGLFSAPAGS